MFHAFDVVTNTKGDSLVGYQIALKLPESGAVVPIFADDAGTPISVVSGIANVALTDGAGNYDFFVPFGTYNIEVRGPDAVLLRTVERVPFNSGSQGGKGDTGPADNTYSSYAAMQASDPTRASARLVGDTDVPPHADGPYNNPTQTVGGWVPQTAAGVTNRQIGSGATTRPLDDVLIDRVSVMDFMTKSDRDYCRAMTAPARDVTYAWLAAQMASRYSWAPPGRYGLDGLRQLNGRSIIGSGEASCIIDQINPAAPAFNCLSDATVGQLLGVELTGFGINGHPNATVRAVFVGARGPYAVTRSKFDFFTFNTFGALDVEGRDAANVYNCDFKVVSQISRDVAVVTTGGVYNKCEWFLTDPAKAVIDDSFTSSDTFVQGENCAIFRGQNNNIACTIEAINAPVAAYSTGIIDNGYGNTFVTATNTMRSEDAGKLTYGFASFAGTIFVNPQIILTPIAHPFFPSSLPFTVVGGRANITNKAEVIFDGSDDSRNLRNISFVGDCSAWVTRAGHHNAKRIQYLAPSATTNLQIDNATDAIVLEPTVDGLTLNVSLRAGIPAFDGWVLTLSTTRPIATINWPAAFANLPTSLAAGGVIRAIYSAPQAKWYTQ